MSEEDLTRLWDILVNYGLVVDKHDEVLWHDIGNPTRDEFRKAIREFETGRPGG